MRRKTTKNYSLGIHKLRPDNPGQKKGNEGANNSGFGWAGSSTDPQ
jgi:hypothetical protein